MMSISQLPAVKKDTIFGAARKLFSPFYFTTALVMEFLSVQWDMLSEKWKSFEKSCYVVKFQ